MKQGHFAMLFCLLYAVCFLSLLAEQKRYDMVLEEKEQIEKALLEAIESTAMQLAGVINDSDVKKKELLESVFFETFFCSLGLMEETETQELLKMYLPLLVLVEEDGASFYHMEEWKANDVPELHHVWSDKLFFSTEKEDCEAERKRKMITFLEDAASTYISNHNYIAEQYGLEYSFSVPKFFRNKEELPEFPILIAVFQGWPLTASENIVYENCIDAAVYIQRTERYIVELPTDLECTWSYYHNSSCPRLHMLQKKRTLSGITKQDAIRQYGAYPCNICN